MSRGRPDSQTARNRAVMPVIIFGFALILLLVPAASAYGEWQHALRYGWPGPYTDANAGAHADEATWKAQVWAIPSLLILIGAAVGAGFAARAAGQRVWLVMLAGVLGTVVVLAMVAVLLTPPLASSS